MHRLTSTFNVFLGSDREPWKVLFDIGFKKHINKLIEDDTVYLWPKFEFDTSSKLKTTDRDKIKKFFVKWISETLNKYDIPGVEGFTSNLAKSVDIKELNESTDTPIQEFTQVWYTYSFWFAIKVDTEYLLDGIDISNFTE